MTRIAHRYSVAGSPHVLTAPLQLLSVPDDPRAEDLDSSPRPIRGVPRSTAERVDKYKTYPIEELERLFQREIEVGGGLGVQMLRDWNTNTRVPPAPQRYAALNEITRNAPAFRDAVGKFVAALHENLRVQSCQGHVDVRDLVPRDGPQRERSELWTPPPRQSLDAMIRQSTLWRLALERGQCVGPKPGTQMSPGAATARLLPRLPIPWFSPSIFWDRVLKICVGNIQGMTIMLQQFRFDPRSRQYTGTLVFHLIDHFGLDDRDCEITLSGLHGTPGQVAGWVLQHHGGPGHKPYLTSIDVRWPFNGSLPPGR